MNDAFHFFTPIKVRFIETDAQGHVNFAHYLAYFDVGLTEYLNALGYSYSNMLADGVSTGRRPTLRMCSVSTSAPSALATPA
ncbi:MAG: hypothetical protein C4310_13665 [Chloroflexota bacterium]